MGKFDALAPTRSVEGEGEAVTAMKSLRTSLRILTEFAGDQRDYGVNELAERCGLAKSQVSKVLDAFSEYGFLVQDPESRRYSVGVRTFALGSRFVTHDRLCRAAMPVMRDLVLSSGHSVRLSVLEGERALYLIGIEGPLFVDSGWRSGTWLPLHSTSSGRILMAFMDAPLVTRLLQGSIRSVTPDTNTNATAVKRLIGEARVKGYAIQRNETTAGLGAISVPIFGTEQHAIATLGIAFPSHMVQVDDEPALVNALHNAARTLSQRLGCVVYPFGKVDELLHMPTRLPAKSPGSAGRDKVKSKAKPKAQSKG